jgi:hypothetical protein
MIYLYVKTHLKTGLKYFGKTTKDPQKYTGSGKYWKTHLKKNGNLVETKIIGTFDNEKECQSFALNFSKENDIVKSKEWANLIDENGLDGAPEGNILSEETKTKISNTLKGKPNPKTKYVMKESREERSNRSKKNSLDTIWINNGIESKRLKSQNIPQGWTKGRIQNGNIGDKNLGKRNDGSNTKGKIIYNNGIRHAYFFENYQPEGWTKGKMKGCQGGTGSNKKGKKYVSKKEI